MLAGLGGCTSAGKLEAARFDYICVDSSDAACDYLFAAPESVIAVGGRFDMKAETTSGEDLTVRPAVVTRVAEDADAFVALSAGPASILAVDDVDTVIDILDVEVRAVAELEVSSDIFAPSSMALTIGEPPFDLLVRALDSEGATLAGALAYSWESSAPDVLEVTGDRRWGTLTPVAPGMATVTVRQGTIERTVEVVVHAP